MKKQKKIVCIIPARLASSRFPKKIIAPLGNKPLIERVWNAACAVPFFSQVVLALDAAQTQTVVEQFQGNYIMTSPYHQSGTDRLIEVMRSGKVEADIWVNWQCDEPFIQAAMIEDLLQSCESNDAEIWTLKKRIENSGEISSTQFAKVVTDQSGNALYFSRSPIPCYRADIHADETKKIYYKHVGLYAYTTAALEKIKTYNLCDIEDAEQLEQLRFLYHNMKIKVHETQYNAYGIDTPADLERAERILAHNSLERMNAAQNNGIIHIQN